jgi:hypothetical protein
MLIRFVQAISNTLPSPSYLSPPNKRVAGLLGSYNNVVENSLGLTIYSLIGKCTHSIIKLEVIASCQMRAKNMTGKTNGMSALVNHCTMV